jgi:allantoinase
MADFDVIFRNGGVVGVDATEPLDVGITEGKIVAMQANLPGVAAEEIDATDLHLFPGVIDAHVHFNEPGRTDWEGIETGSRAFAAGGGTLFFDMPLNAHPPTIDAASFDLKLAAAQKSSVTDFTFWGGLVPENLNHLQELAERGVVGFKAFMSNSGIEDFHCADDRTLKEGMRQAAGLNLPVAVHAESESLTAKLAAGKIARGKTSVRDYLDSRPIVAELEAIRRAIDLASETGCALHVVHVSSADGVAIIAEAKRNNVDVSCETCPHYFTLTDDDMERIGALAKCAPPLRSAEEQQTLWDSLLAGEIDTIGSDHSPSPPGMKTDENFFKVWGGISGVQHMLSLLLARRSGGDEDPALAEGQSLLTSAATRYLALVGRLLSSNVARRFNLPKTKGRIEIGCDADLALVDLAAEFKVRTEDLLYRHKQTPYSGRKLRGRVVRTFLRGQTIFSDGKIVAKPAGHLVKPLL